MGIIEEAVVSSLTPEEAVEKILSQSSVTSEEGILYCAILFYNLIFHLIDEKPILDSL